MKRSYELRILGLFLVLLIAYIGFAWLVLAPRGYYGTTEEPRFKDPWFERAETILSGGNLYEDINTTTPPLTNFLLIPPVVVANWFGKQNPWATLSFMVYFSLFNLFSAYALFYAAKDKKEGFRWAWQFLVNPLTIGNAVLRRQDESILVFFFALALLYLLHRKGWLSSIVIGLSMLVKLTGGILLPVAFLNTHNWRYLIIPFLVFGIIFAPFFLASGESAVFWNIEERHTEHPFQFGGVSIGALWDHWPGYEGDTKDQVLNTYSIAFVIGVILTMIWIAWKPQGPLEDFALLLIAVFLLSPKLHCGYFTFLILAMAPLLDRYRLHLLYYGFATLALAADIAKFPWSDYALAMALMVVVLVLILVIAIKIRRPRPSLASALLVLTLLVTGCISPATHASPLPSPTPLPRTFDGDLAYTWVTQQCDLGYRVTGTQANYQAGDLFIAELNAQGWEVEEQTFNYRETPVRNILAWRGEGPAILIGAHYDSRRAADQEDPSQPVMGANDGASGAAVLLELARALDAETLDNRVYLAFFDAEDNGNLDGWDWIVGSTYMADHWGEGGEPPLTAMVLVDMIGDADQQIYYEHNSNQALREQIWSIAGTLGYQSRIVPELRHSMLDDHIPFVRQGIPAVDMIDFDYPYWHTLRDTPDKVSPESLEAVGRTLEVWIEKETTP